MGSVALRIVLAILSCSSRLCEIRVVQDPIVSGLNGSTVNLSCHVHMSGHKVERITPNWNLKTPNKAESVFRSSKYKGRSSFSNERHLTDMSLTLTGLQLSDTGLYECKISVLNGSTNFKTGNGTLLFVHEPMQIVRNDTEVNCKIKVKMVEKVTLIWQNEHGQTIYGNGHNTEVWNLDGSYWISINMTLQAKQSQDKSNRTFICMLQHSSGYNITNQTLEIPWIDMSCPCDQRHPIGLYISVLIVTVLILLIVLFIFLVKKNSRSLKMPNTSIF